MINSFKVSDVNFTRLDEKNPYFHMIKAIRPTTGLKILDIGCGRERKYQILDFILADEGCIVTGIDIEGKNEKVSNNLRFVHGSIEDFTTKEKFDVVMSSFFFGYVSDDWNRGNYERPTKDFEFDVMEKIHDMLNANGLSVHYMNEPWHLNKKDFETLGFEILNYPDFEGIEGGLCVLRRRDVPV